MVSRRKQTKRQASNRAVATKSVNRALVPFTPKTQRVLPKRSMKALFKPRHGLSEAGLAFLKCAFAAPDFSVDPGKGIPDNFHGRTLSIKDCNTTAITFTPNTDTYIVQAPVPGFAYFKAEVPIGTDPEIFTGVPFPTYDTNFGSGIDSANKFSKFRYASLASGIYPTSNMMQFSGSIQVWRVDLNLAESLSSFSTTTPPYSDVALVGKRIQGMQGIITLAPRDNLSTSFINGAYTFGFDKTEDFQWQDFCSSVVFAQNGNVPAAGKRLISAPNTRLTGLGNTNSVVYKISTPQGAVNTAIFRAWNCIELQPDTNSSLFQFSGVSPPFDPIAMELYHKLKMRFPVAVSAAENGKFWETVLRAIMEASKLGKLLPGPLGMMSAGVNTIATTLGDLYL